MMTEERARAAFSQFGWRLYQGVNADGIDTRLTSLHELHHDRLQVTTAHGFLTHVLSALATETGDTRWEELVRGVQSASRRVHEQFATWCSTAMLNLTRDELAAQLPGYVAYYDDVEAMVAAAPTAYLRSHLVHSIHRVAMQTDVLELVARRGLRELRLGDLDRTRRPDWRMRRIQTSAESCARALTAAVHERWSRDARWPELQVTSLTEGLFAVELDDVWDDVNRRAYVAVRGALAATGAPTIDYDGHTDWTAEVLEQARAIAGSRLQVQLVSEAPDRADADVAIFSMEGERLVLRAEPLPGRLVVEPVERMIAGEPPYEHVYVSIRGAARLREQWRIDGAGLPAGDAAVAVVRRTVQTPDGRVVELRVIDDPSDLDGCRHMLVGDISMAAYGEPEIAERWTPALDAEDSVVLFDLQPSHHLRLWLRDPSARLRYAVLSAERTQRTTMVYMVQLVTGEGRSRLFLTPASDLFVRSIRAWLSDVGLDDRAQLDPSMIEQNDRVLQIALGHMLGEEYSFDFLAGRRR
jgi:hypothetical protein